VNAKRLGLLHELVPKAVRVAVLTSPAGDPSTGTTYSRDVNLQDVQDAARIIGLQIQILNATTIGEIDAAFATLARERPDALFVAPNGIFVGHLVQIISLAARDKIPATYADRLFVAAGGLMSYGADMAEN
jgi:putative ABC transport system substrate-binding protein